MYKQPIKHELGANAGAESMNSAEETVTRRSILKHWRTNVTHTLLLHVNDVGESGLCSHFHLIKEVNVGH